MNKTQITEQTGKRYKAHIALSSLFLVIFGGVALAQLWAETPSSFILWTFYVVLGWHLGARFFAWWNHG